MRSRGVLLVALLPAITAGCGDVVEPPAAVVNGHEIRIDEVTAALERFEVSPEFERAAQGGDPDALRREFEQSYLAQLVRRHVLRPAARQRGVEVTADEIDERIEEISATFPDEEAFVKAVAEQGLTRDALEELVRDRILEEKLREAVGAEADPSADELGAFYVENRDDFRETAARHIVVQQRTLAQQLLDQLRAVPEDEFDRLFADLAREHSTDRQSGPQGGDLGYFRPGQFVEPFERAAAALDIGDLSGIVKSEHGFHIIEVYDRRTPTFTEVRSEIAARLAGGAAEEAWSRWIVDAYRDADIRINPRYGVLQMETQLVVNPDPGDAPGVEAPTPTTVAPVTPSPGG